MKWVKDHWFGMIMWLWVVAVALVMVMVLLSPHYDAKNRGFAFCTQQLIEKLEECDKKIACSTVAVLDNTICDVKIIGKSFKEWVDGKHPYPWSGYIFAAEIPLSSFINEDERREYLEEYPDTLAEMEKLKFLRKDLENAQNKHNDEKKFSLPKAVTGMGFE